MALVLTLFHFSDYSTDQEHKIVAITKQYSVQQKESLSDKMTRFASKLMQLTHGTTQALRQGIMPTYLLKKQWTEVIVDSYLLSSALDELYKEWTEAKTTLCFQDWVIMRKGSAWFWQGTFEQDDGSKIPC